MNLLANILLFIAEETGNIFLSFNCLCCVIFARVSQNCYFGSNYNGERIAGY